MISLRRSQAHSGFLKVALAGVIIVATGVTLSQLRFVNRVLSAVDLEIDVGAANSALTTRTMERATFWDQSLASSESTSAPGLSQPRRTNGTRPSFKTHPEFSEELMDEMIANAREMAEKRRQYIQMQNKKDKDAKKTTTTTRKKNQKDKRMKRIRARLKVPTPVFVPSLPKSGTTTTHQYFLCGGRKSAHLAARNGDDMFKIGRCAQRNVMADRPPFAGCGDYDVWTDTGYVAARYRPDGSDLRRNNIQCYYPLIDALEKVYDAYPNATFLFVVRETEGWLRSVESYHDGFIMDVWRRCRTRGFPGLDGTLEDFRDFYEWHKELIRTFALEHPSLTYIEVDLESEDAGQILQDKVGIDASCWGHHNKGAKTEHSDTKSGRHQFYQEESIEE